MKCMKYTLILNSKEYKDEAQASLYVRLMEQGVGNIDLIIAIFNTYKDLMKSSVQITFNEDTLETNIKKM